MRVTEVTVGETSKLQLRYETAAVQFACCICHTYQCQLAHAHQLWTVYTVAHMHSTLALAGCQGRALP
jgi:hypothetical protein